MLKSYLLTTWDRYRYKQFSLQFYTILMKYAEDLEAVSVDEALIDVSNRVVRHAEENPSTGDPAKEFAETIRAEVKKATGCEGQLSGLIIHSSISNAFPLLGNS